MSTSTSTSTSPSTTSPAKAISDYVFELFRPVAGYSTWEWVCEHVRAPNGATFDYENYPWGRGVCEAFDDPNVREIDLMWGSRLGKTFISHGILLSQWANNPMPTMFGSSTEPLATTIVREKLYPMLERCGPLSRQLKPPSRRSMHRIDLAANHCRIAWSGSDTSLADFGAYLLHGNEVSKWSSDSSREADPLELFVERVKEFPDHKVLLEGTPTIKGVCRIDRRMQDSSYRTYWVPCPKCGKYQVLVLGEDTPGERGIIWDKGPDGHSDPDLAYATARYVCEHCRYEIYDDQRARMMRAGVWAPRGCHVDARGRVKGTAKRQGRVEGFQLASWYSLQMRWGDMAQKWVRSFRRPKERQNVINSWGGLPYELVSVVVTPEMLADRLATDVPQATVPAGVAFLTIGVDRQGDHRVFWVMGWGADETGYLIDYGTVQEDTELLEGVIRRVYAAADGVRKFRAALVLYDSGFETEDVYAFCNQHSSYEQPILPCKGNEHCAGQSYRKVRLGEKGKVTTMRRAALSAKGQILIHVPNDYWQPVIQQYLERGRPGQPASIAFCREATGDMDLCEQLLNGVRNKEMDKKGRTKMLWVKRDPHAPDDFRDALKYARVAAELWLRSRWARVKLMLERAGTAPILEPNAKPAPVVQAPKPQPFVRQPARSLGRRRGGGFVRRRRGEERD